MATIEVAQMSWPDLVSHGFVKTEAQERVWHKQEKLSGPDLPSYILSHSLGYPGHISFSSTDSFMRIECIYAGV